MQKVKSTAIGILGMHRSGTSVTTRVVNLLGAYIGEEEEMIRPDPNNPAGYYEHQPINTLHNRILEVLFRAWDTAFPLPPNWHHSHDIAPFRDELIEIIESRFANRALWAWKDPRSSILLPLWIDVLAKLNIELRCLLVYRNPLDVARSLKTRDGFSREESLGLWLNHNLAMLCNSEGLPRTLVSYHGLLADPAKSVARWASRFSLHWSPDDKEMPNILRQTVRKDLCHSTSTLGDLMKAKYPKPVVELARLLNAMARTGDLENPAYRPIIGRLMETHLSFAGLYSHDFIRAEQAKSELRSELRTKSANLEQTLAALKGKERRPGEQESILNDATEKTEELGYQLAESQSENRLQQQQYEAQLTEAREQTQRQEGQLTELQSQVAFKEQQLIESHAALAEKGVALAESQSQQRQYEAQLTEAREQTQRQEGQLTELRSQVAFKEQQLVESREALVEKATALAESWLQQRQYEAQLTELQLQVEIKEQQLVESAAALAEKGAALAESESQQRQYERQLTEAREHTKRQEGQLTEFRSQVALKDQQLEGLQGRLDRIRKTFSWRMTSPLRAVMDVLLAIWWKLYVFWYELSSRVGLPRMSPGKTDSSPISDNLSAKREGTYQAVAAPASAGVPKLIAFYLPQFHPIPENDQWWGKGFTEWTNVSRARALFKGHHQPRRPSELGYYDLRVAEVQKVQAELARSHGIHGFCYYYYWFDGRRLLERPLDQLLDSGMPDFPFCLCWANESWSRRWDGTESDILIAQNYHDGFAEQFAEDVVRYLQDPRYIRVGGRPLLLVYRVGKIPQPERVVATWRQVFRDRGVGEVILGAVQAFGLSDPTPFGFDVAIEFPPHNAPKGEHKVDPKRLRSIIQDLNPDFHGLLRDYRDCVRSRSTLEPQGFPLFRGVMPSWDNTARSDLRAMIYHHASPQAYQEWLSTVLRSAAKFSVPYEPVVFINAWNEWAEGTYLEPDATYGDAYLKATKAALDSIRTGGDGALELALHGGAQDSLVSSIVVPESKETPEISIIIPAFNQAKLTRECLNSLGRHKAALPFEVLVVDDGSSDETPTLAQEFPWVRFIRRDQNNGFGSACNLGAEKARGQYLVFLNNDTTVSDGWLDALHETFEHWPRAGLVGSKLIHLDGTMQECGSLIFRDGSAANYGRGGDPKDPRYCFARETDYVSGAAMMIRADLFREFEGFDARYEPAYYEDTDLALRVREKGLQVIVNPHAMVWHHEGGTAGMDTSKGIKRYQVLNQEKFFERWKDVLSHFPERPEGDPGIRLSGPRVLVIDWIVPRPDCDSGSLRMVGILEALQRLNCHVTLASKDLRCEEGDVLPLERIGVEVLRRPYNHALDPYLIEKGKSFDYVIVSRRDTAKLHIDSIKRHCTNAKLVYDTCDLHFVREEREARIGTTNARPKDLDTMKALELDFIARSDITLVVSPEEQEVLHSIIPQQDVRILSNIIEPRPTPLHFGERSGLIFIGFFLHTPNVDGVLWFAKEVLPELARLGLKPVFHVVGSDPPPEVLELESEQVKIHGYVPDVDWLFDSCRLSVAPLRFGAGVKGKITQSMALGVPCVTTSIGAEGTYVQDRISGMVADSAPDFAKAIEAAYQSEKLWSKLREGGLRNIRQYFSPEVAQAVLADLVTQSSCPPH